VRLEADIDDRLRFWLLQFLGLPILSGPSFCQQVVCSSHTVEFVLHHGRFDLVTAVPEFEHLYKNFGREHVLRQIEVLAFGLVELKEWVLSDLLQIDTFSDIYLQHPF
jgi:hypothetical protein